MAESGFRIAKRPAVALATLGCHLLAGLLLGTAQAPDTIVLDGEERILLTNPLEPFLEKNPNVLPEPTVVSTGLWRGYVAAWQIADGRLFLRSIRIPASIGGRFRDVTAEVFDRERPIPAEWYSGYLVVATGKLARYEHMGYASLYRRYAVLRIDQGRVLELSKMTAREFVSFRRAQFEKFKRTTEYRELLKQADGNEEFVFQFASERFQGKVFDEH